MTTKTQLHLLLLILFIGIYLLPLGVRPLMEPDETRYGEIPREMIASGNWVSPHLNGLRYFEKPPLGYWANGLSILVFGENAFALRLPQALSVGLSVLIIMLMIRQSCPQDEIWAGPVAGFILLSSLEVAGVGTFSVLDSMLACTLTSTMACFFLACQAERGSRRQRWFLLGAGVSCGLAFLTKGFLALVVPALSVGAYLVWERRWRDLAGLAWLPLLAAALTALPWSLAIHSQEPDFWNYFFWHEHVKRFLGGAEAQHAQPFWSFVLSATAMFLPWTFLAPAAGLGLQGSGQPPAARQLVRFCLAWCCLPFLFFSLSSGKLLTYILPCFPPLAILVSLGLLAGLGANKQRLFQIGSWMASLLFALLAVALVAIQVFGIGGTPRPYTQTWQWLLALVSLSGMALMPLLACRAQAPGTKVLLFGLGMTLSLGAAPFLMPDQVNEKKSPGALLLRHKAEISTDTIILSDGNSVNSVCWYWQRSDVLLISGLGELTYGHNSADAPRRLLGLAASKGEILANPGRVVLAVRGRNYRKWAAELPPPREIDDNGKDGYVVVRY